MSDTKGLEAPQPDTTPSPPRPRNCKGLFQFGLGAQLLSHVQLFAAPWTVACQAPLSTEFSSQEYWSGFPFPTPEDLPDRRIEPRSLMSPELAGRFGGARLLAKVKWWLRWKAFVYNVGDLGSIPGSGSSLEKETATHSSTLAWKIPWMEEPGVHGVTKSWTQLSDFTF